MDLIIGILLLGGLTSTYGFLQSEDSDCPPEWMHAPTKDCFKFLPSKTNMSWFDALYECEEVGGYLAEPKTLDQMEFLVEISSFYGLNLWWIGLSDLGNEGIWSWQHSVEIVSNGFWDSGCPSNQSDNRLDCAYLSGDQLAWKDGDCRNSKMDHDLIAPICQKETYFPHNTTTTYSPNNTTRTTNFPHNGTTPSRTTHFPHNVTTPSITTHFPHNGTTPSITTHFPHNGTTPSRTTNFPHNGTTPSRTTNFPQNGTTPSITTNFPQNGTTPSRTTNFPHNVTTPSITTNFPHNGTTPSITTHFPHNGTTPSITTHFPHNGTTPSITTHFPHNGTTPSRTTHFPHNGTTPSRTTNFPHNGTTPSRTTNFPHNGTTPSRTTKLPHNTTTTRTTYFPHTNTTTAGFPETTTADGCPFAWSEFDGSCFYLIPESMTWLEARETCHSFGADLASIHSKEQDNFIFDLVHGFDSRDRYYWLGGTDSHSEGSWEWSNGSPWDYQNWDDKNGNGGVVFNCLSYYNHCNANCGSDYNWHQVWTDLECSRLLLSLCQIN